MPFKRSEIVEGAKYGYITLLYELPDEFISNRRFRMVMGKCICGRVKKYRFDAIVRRKSCGCKTKDILVKNGTKHGLTAHPLFSTWQNMKNRCRNKKVDSFKYYGAKGVWVSEEWYNDFESFYKWSIQNGWGLGLTLDRYPDTKGNYEPTNCRWATMKVQQNNKTTTVFFEYNGESKTLSELSDQYGFKYKDAYHLIHRKNYSIEQVISEYTPKVKELKKRLK